MGNTGTRAPDLSLQERKAVATALGVWSQPQPLLLDHNQHQASPLRHRRLRAQDRRLRAHMGALEQGAESNLAPQLLYMGG